MRYDLSKETDKTQASAYFDLLCAQGARIELTKKHPTRSISQNDYFHVVLTCWGGHLGYTLSEMKQRVKEDADLCRDTFAYHKHGRTFYHSSASLDTKAMTKVIDKIRRTALERDGYYIAKPEEYALLDQMKDEAARYEAWQV